MNSNTSQVLSEKSSLSFTDAAVRKIKELINEESKSGLNFRVFIKGGGCSGFQYNFAFDETVNPDDFIIEKTVRKFAEKENEKNKDTGYCHQMELVRLLVDPVSLQYLIGAEIDYREDVNGSQFVIRNPNAKTTCGCGSSFSA
ncbi:iron-sulfur cluster insertion protein ErpA [Coxiella endosymbiont of Amblyomma americanum]|uniref:iron-sulfur cluster insertion protein ErpA n=1 Tax=Coxiella endosymbiont of Amblyomma americanum TaxID=325775 RepID=UPI00057E81A7|nr:iron-sulfur cluster insertion protein ErpA [Coxiella endosymbiont of Amblyomma americanum]AJC50173.1 hypothetical protein Z664_00145 [Coxiella endosymbiont of Amblyomma americanum]AUJ58533.1 iron-sulfur cluster insertion protein ErpA [Coxiella-like endosymbiont of Amblyomma americanum]